MRNFTFLLILFCIGMFSCKPILHIAGQYKKPKFEDEISLRNFCGNENVGNLFVIKDLESFAKVYDSISNDLPSLYVFNRDRNQIYYDVSCSWAKISNLDSIYTNQNINDITLNVDKVLSFFKQVNTDVKNSDVNQEYDYYIIYSWAKYVPKLSKIMMKDVAKIKEMYKDKNIYFASINYDLQKAFKDEEPSEFILNKVKK